MRTALLPWLTGRRIWHPTNLVSTELGHNGLTLTITGPAWWLGEGSPSRDGTLRIIFGSIEDGEIDALLSNPEGNDELLEDFSVRPIDDVPPFGGHRHQVFCYGPLQDPFALYMAVEDYLTANGAFYTTAHYLNRGQTLSRFVALARETSFLVASGPDAVRDLVCRELVKQGVPHNVVAVSARADDRLLVSFGGRGFLCRDAWAEFADP